MRDRAGDGMCCEHGRGKVEIDVEGQRAVETGSEDYKMRKYSFEVTPRRNNNNSNNNKNPPINNGKECSVVKPIDYTKKFTRGRGYAGFPGFQCYRTV
eukprot:CAMPEP_0172562692 /NCGR_PEP_ID=MMETSP1067-20121228/98047_1 /TAXON_ID=265564 ORGANISM="Thalassiosira punctigera, Strain Tpunct2005C2" /NCGR_SAMPLE_ID=MMETSP1067 /ASSEMBLY_ACC=CAM_ASM_000444 /LENGTH=97 /DNA_ID=CAMNT_0013352973 /DNA_START=3 /DNA_END=293 /DNA_ORIENTATION=-